MIKQCTSLDASANVCKLRSARVMYLVAAWRKTAVIMEWIKRTTCVAKVIEYKQHLFYRCPCCLFSSCMFLSFFFSITYFETLLIFWLQFIFPSSFSAKVIAYRNYIYIEKLLAATQCTIKLLNRSQNAKKNSRYCYNDHNMATCLKKCLQFLITTLRTAWIYLSKFTVLYKLYVYSPCSLAIAE